MKYYRGIHSGYIGLVMLGSVGAEAASSRHTVLPQSYDVRLQSTQLLHAAYCSAALPTNALCTGGGGKTRKLQSNSSREMGSNPANTCLQKD